MERAAKLFAERLKDPRRVRDAARPADPRRRRRTASRAPTSSSRRSSRTSTPSAALFADARGEARGRTRSSRPTRRSIPLEDIAARAARSVAADRPALLQSGRADDAGRDRRRRATRDPALVAAGAAFVRADRQAAAAGEERAGIPGQPRARALPDERRCAASTKASRPRPSTKRRSPSACRWGRSSSPTPSASTSASPSASMLGGDAEPPSRLAELRRGGPARARRPGGLLRTGASGKPQKQAAGAVPAGLARAARRPVRRRSAGGARRSGIVADADLVDAGAIFGTGFAPFRGGPLHYARQRAAGLTPVSSARTARCRVRAMQAGVSRARSYPRLAER